MMFSGYIGHIKVFGVILVILVITYYFGHYRVSRIILVILEFFRFIFIILGILCVFWLF